MIRHPYIIRLFGEEMIMGHESDGCRRVVFILDNSQLIDPVTITGRPWKINGHIINNGFLFRQSQRPGSFKIGDPFRIGINIGDKR